jgi:hypothetical protein
MEGKLDLNQSDDGMRKKEGRIRRMEGRKDNEGRKETDISY